MIRICVQGMVSETLKEWRLPTSAAVDSASGNRLERPFEQALTGAASLYLASNDAHEIPPTLFLLISRAISLII